MSGCKCETSTIALISFGVFFSFLLAVSILSSVYFAPGIQAIEYVSVKGSGQYLVPLDGSLWSSDAMIACNTSNSTTYNVTAYRFDKRPSAQSKYHIHDSEEWSSQLQADSWDAWNFFLVEGSSVKWNVTTSTSEPTSFYVFGSAEDYHQFVSDKPVKPIVAVNDSKFSGVLSIDNYNEYFFVAKAIADVQLEWKVDFWKSTFIHDHALESCDILYGMCQLKTGRNDYILVEVNNDDIQKETKVAVMVPVDRVSYWLFIGALILTSTIVIPALSTMLILH